MKEKLGSILAVLAMASAVVLVLVAIGVMPAREPRPLTPEQLDVDKAIERAPIAQGPSASPKTARTLPVWTLPLCEAPVEGARLYRVVLRATDEAYLVWCKGGYTLVDVALGADAPVATRLAQFSTRGELPGGAAAGDLDGDGALDLVLAVAPSASVVHQSGTGVYWVRGRLQGGYDAPRALVETPTVALATLDLDGAGGTDLAVLTRGDVTAQRPGELFMFARGPALARVAVAPLGLDPRDLAIVRSETGEGHEAWMVSGQPGALLRLPITRDLSSLAKSEKQSFALRGVQAFAKPHASERSLFVRDPSDVYELALTAEHALEPWAEKVHVGPAAVVDLDGDGRLDVLASIDGGFAWIDDESHALDEVDLPSGVRVLDVDRVRDTSGRERGLLLIDGGTDAGGLSLALLPPPPWDGLDVELRRAKTSDAPTKAMVTLE